MLEKQRERNRLRFERRDEEIVAVVKIRMFTVQYLNWGGEEMECDPTRWAVDGWICPRRQRAKAGRNVEARPSEEGGRVFSFISSNAKVARGKG